MTDSKYPALALIVVTLDNKGEVYGDATLYHSIKELKHDQEELTNTLCEGEFLFVAEIKDVILPLDFDNIDKHFVPYHRCPTCNTGSIWTDGEGLYECENCEEAFTKQELENYEAIMSSSYGGMIF